MPLRHAQVIVVFMEWRDIETRFGWLSVAAKDGAIVRLDWGRRRCTENAVLEEAVAQLLEYDEGDRETFDLPLRVERSDFQRAVCETMCAIPFGYTRTYGEIASELGVPAQAVGQACGANPIPIIIPCHRVMGTKGLTGFSGAGGVETKVALLRHEGAASLLI